MVIFLHQQVEELEVILVEILGDLADLADLVVQDKVHEVYHKVHEVDQKVHEPLDEEEHQDHQRRQMLVVMESWSHLSFVLGCNKWGLTSRIFLPEYNHCPRTRVKCGAEKIELGYRTMVNKSNWAARQTLTPIGLERRFQRSTQAVDSPLAAKMSKSPPSVP